jgi:hypothetical protein
LGYLQVFYEEYYGHLDRTLRGARQYCGQLGKQDNCQVAVSVSMANEHFSLPVSYQLYLPQSWADDPTRRAQCKVPETIGFATKPAIALQLLERMGERRRLVFRLQALSRPHMARRDQSCVVVALCGSAGALRLARSAGKRALR